MLNCGSMKELMTSYIDGELEMEARSAFENHIRICSGCRREFEELKGIVDACHEIEEAELPSGFREELHARLLLVSGQESARKDRIQLRTKRIRIFSSIAAGILVILLAGGFYDLGLLRYPAQSSKTGNLANTGMQGQETPAANKKSAAPASGARANGSGTNDTQMADSFAADEVQAQAGAGTEVDRSGSGDKRSTQTMATFGLSKEPANMHTSSLTITLSDPEAMVQNVKDLALQSGGDYKNAAGESNLDGTAVVQGIAPAPGASVDASAQNSGLQSSMKALAPSTDIVLDFSIPYAQYDSFISSLDSSFGQSGIQVSPVITEDLSARLDDLIKQEENMDADIKKLEEANGQPDDEKLKQLKDSRASVEAEIEKIRLGTDFIEVTVILKKVPS